MTLMRKLEHNVRKLAVVQENPEIDTTAFGFLTGVVLLIGASGV